MPRPSILVPIPAERQKGRNWRVSLDGRLIDHVNTLTIDHPVLGTLTYGDTPAGYDSWAFHEAGGGGAVTLPFAILDDALWIGLVHQQRPNQGGDVWNVPRGFLDPGERHEEAARRELTEETGYDVAMGRVFALPGARANPNSTFFETWGDGEGVHFYALEVAPDELLVDGDRWAFRPERIASRERDRGNRVAEMIYRAQFLPWHEAAGVSDMFTNAAVARLLAHLRRSGINYR
jgi:ADP-ribose pyrophosphatase YjhB (NUDIX family)